MEDEEEYRRYAYVEPDHRDTGAPVYALVNGGRFAEMRIREIHEMYPGVFVTLVYDEAGRPLAPYPDRVVRDGWRLRVWGPRRLLECLAGR